jgi:hypothetical protein
MGIDMVMVVVGDDKEDGSGSKFNRKNELLRGVMRSTQHVLAVPVDHSSWTKEWPKCVDEAQWQLWRKDGTKDSLVPCSQHVKLHYHSQALLVVFQGLPNRGSVDQDGNQGSATADLF